MTTFIAGMALMAVIVVLAVTVVWVLRPRQVAPRQTRRPSAQLSGFSVPHSEPGVPAYRVESEDAVYRVRPGTQDATRHWNPFDPGVAREAQVRAARRKPRPLRGTHHDCYALLGVESSASDREIERAYRMRAAAIHPDRHHANPAARRQAEEQLRQLNAAVALLRDPLRRAKHDARR